MITRLLAVSLLITSSVSAAPPNVVLFLVDDMGWRDCGVYGSTYYETPRIDAFAKQAMRFTNAYAQPLCSPTRASLLTGQYSARHAITSATGHTAPQAAGAALLPTTAAPNSPMLLPESKNYLEPAQITLAETLRSAGYRTAHIGKWHLGLTAPHWPEQQGFDVTFHCHPDPGPPGGYFSPYDVQPDRAPTSKSRAGNITDGPDGEYIVDRQADEAVKFIQGSKEKPFFLNLWCYGVHGPWGHKEAYTREFAAKRDPSGLQGNPIMASMLRSVDECFGRILDELEKQGLAENTIVIFNSDNGGNTHSNIPTDPKRKAKAKPTSPEQTDWQKWAGDQPPTNNAPLRDGKGTLYEGGCRVPLMWRWPSQIKGGSVNDSIVGHIDVYPTLIDLLRLEKPAGQHIDGTSYAQVLRGTGPLERTAFFNYFPHHHPAVWVRRGDHKLIRWFGNPNTHELFNLREDLSEAQDLAPTQLALVKELDALIDGFLADTGATYPRPNPAAQAARTDPPADPMRGLVLKQSKASPIEGGIRIDRAGAQPFMASGALKQQSGPLTVKLRARSDVGGVGRAQWSLEDADFLKEGQTSEFTWPSGPDWQDVQFIVPVKGAVRILRLHLPAKGHVEVQSLRIEGPGEKGVAWDLRQAGR
jgi:arylsulfatase A-like enzyme